MTRRMGKREQTFTTELTGWNPPRSYAFRGIDGPVRPIGKGTLEPIGEASSTRFTFSIDFEGHGLGKLLVPLVVKRQAKKEIVQSHEALKNRLESSSWRSRRELGGEPLRSLDQPGRPRAAPELRAPDRLEPDLNPRIPVVVRAREVHLRIRIEDQLLLVPIDPYGEPSAVTIAGHPREELAPDAIRRAAGTSSSTSGRARASSRTVFQSLMPERARPRPRRPRRRPPDATAGTGTPRRRR